MAPGQPCDTLFTNHINLLDSCCFTMYMNFANNLHSCSTIEVLLANLTTHTLSTHTLHSLHTHSTTLHTHTHQLIGTTRVVRSCVPQYPVPQTSSDSHFQQTGEKDINRKHTVTFPSERTVCEHCEHSNLHHPTYLRAIATDDFPPLLSIPPLLDAAVRITSVVLLPPN